MVGGVSPWPSSPIPPAPCARSPFTLATAGARHEGALVHLACSIHAKGITKDPDAFTEEPIGPRQERERARKARARARHLIDDARGLRRVRGRVGTASAVLLLLGTVAAEPAWADPMFFARAFDAACTPDLYIFDKHGKLAYRGQFDAARPSNDVKVSGCDARAAVAALLAGHSPTSEQIPSIGCNIKWKE